MRLILFFDLPSKEDYEKKDYRLFHNALIKNGYVINVEDGTYSKMDVLIEENIKL